jgi:hypothetical protein
VQIRLSSFASYSTARAPDSPTRDQRELPLRFSRPVLAPDLGTLFCCAHTSVYTLRVKVPGNPHPWYKWRGQ